MRAGDYPTKNGGASGSRDGGVGGTKSTLSFPSGIAAYITVNSINNNLGGLGLADILKNAFDASIR